MDATSGAPLPPSKRALDVFVACSVLLAAGPILPFVALAVRLSGPGPILYRSLRMGQGGRPFRMLKFRTMRVEADREGPPVTVSDDARVTPVGRFLRATKLDELPQFLNVLAGDMSIVGPRPEHPSFLEDYAEEQRRILAYRPGITSPASLEYRDEAALIQDSEEGLLVYRSEILPDKIALDLQYFERATWWSDLRMVARTAGQVTGSIMAYVTSPRSALARALFLVWSGLVLSLYFLQYTDLIRATVGRVISVIGR